MKYNFCINDFEGPLDLLLHLVKESKMDIYEINISLIIEQYLDFIHSLKEKNIDVASDYLIMASELIHLKSKMLINKKDEEELEDEFSINSEDELRKRLIEYEKYKEVLKEFQTLEEKRSEVYTKIPENIKEYADVKKLPKGFFDLDDLFEAYKNFLNRKEKEKPLNTRITRKELRIEDKIKYIRDVLSKHKRVEFFDLFDSFDKENVVVTFLSVLEMAKKEEILLSQKDNFSAIMIEKRV